MRHVVTATHAWVSKDAAARDVALPVHELTLDDLFTGLAASKFPIAAIDLDDGQVCFVNRAAADFIGRSRIQSGG